MQKGGRLRAERTISTLVLAGLLGGTGCLRFAYSDVDRPRGKSQDAGMDSGSAQLSDAGNLRDASQPTAAGAGGHGGSGGRSAVTAGRSAVGGASGQGELPMDAGAMDASSLDGSTRLDAGTAEAGSGDAGTDSASPAGDPCVGRSDLLWCRAWDKDPYEGIEYAIVTPNGAASAELSTTIKHSGLGSLHVQTWSPAANTSARFATRSLNGKTSGDFWLRYYYYVPSTVQINKYFSSGVASEIEYPYSGFSLLIFSNYVQIESMVGPSVQGPAFPRDQWVCVELHAHIHSSTGLFEAYMDGTKIGSVGGNTVPATGYTAAEVGIHYIPGDENPVEAYVDETILSTERVPCN